MTNEELDKARAEHAWSDHYKGDGRDPTVIAARLAREGWTPPPPVDPDMVEADLIASEVYASDKPSFCDAARMGIKRGRALAAAEAKPGMFWVKHDGSEIRPVSADQYVWVRSFGYPPYANKARHIAWQGCSHYAVITPPAEDVA